MFEYLWPLSICEIKALTAKAGITSKLTFFWLKVSVMLLCKGNVRMYESILTNVNRFPQKHFVTPSLVVWSISSCENCNFSLSLIIYRPSIIEKSSTSNFCTSRHGMKFKFTLGIPLNTLEVDRWRYQLDHMSLSENHFRFVNYTSVT